MNCFSGITNNVVSPSWTLILPESWDESKTDFKGEVDGFKIGEGEGEGRKKYACPQPLFVWRTRTPDRRGL